MTYLVLAYLLIGLCAGFLAGLLGIGGGLVIVPALLFLLPYQGMPTTDIIHVAVATSLATVILTSLSAAFAHHRHHAVEWPIFWRMAPGLLGGALIGAMIAAGLSGNALRVSFGAFALLVALQMGLRLRIPRNDHSLPTALGLTVAGTCIGMFSAMVGVGGGTLTVPFLHWGNVLMQRAVATSSACGFPIAIGGTLGFSLMHTTTGHSATHPSIYWPAALSIAVASIIAAPVGAKCAHLIPTSPLVQIFAVVLAIIGIRLIGV